MRHTCFLRARTIVLASVFLLLAFARPRIACGDEAAVNATADTNSVDLAIFPWGNPQFTDGDLNCYPRPLWTLAGWMDGGLWITSDDWYGWQPSLGEWTPDLTANRLLIQLDRTQLSNNLWIAVAATGDPTATLLAGFHDHALLSISEPVVLYVADGSSWRTNSIDLAQLPAASILSLSATNGMLRIFTTILAPGRDTSESTNAPLVPPSRGSPDVPGSTTNSTVITTPPAPTPVPTPVPRAPGSSAPIALKPAHIWYVDQKAGNDLAHDGTAPAHVQSTSIGPKRTIAAALTKAVCGDTIFVASGVYSEHVRIDGVRLITTGRVVF